MQKYSGMAADDGDDGVIEVQVIPQDDNWGETATVTTATSYVTSVEDLDSLDEKPKRDFSLHINGKQALGIFLSCLLSFLALVSPVLFVVLPLVLSTSQFSRNSATERSENLLLNLAVKEIVLVVGLWALYFRRKKATLPRVDSFRALTMCLAFLILLCFWLFYALRIISRQSVGLHLVADFALSLADSMLLVHYASVILLWIRHTDPVYTLKIVRSTDGRSRHYNVGQLTLQRAALFVLENYFRDFPEYNPYMAKLTRSSVAKRMSSLKFYDVDGKSSGGGAHNNSSTTPTSQTRAVIAASSRRREGRNDRFYEEAEYDRRVKKRKARLYVAAEEAFSHVMRLEYGKPDGNVLDPDEAAQAVFPSLSRPLQKYLRTTRQQPRFSGDSILKHLAHCINYDLSPKAFLERYVVDQPCASFAGARSRPEWQLASVEATSRQIADGMTFQLKTTDYHLVVTVHRMAHFVVKEEAIDLENNKFILRMNSETSV